MSEDSVPYESTPLGQAARAVAEAPDDTDRHSRITNALRAAQPSQAPRSRADEVFEAHQAAAAEEARRHAEEAEERRREERAQLGVLDDFGVQQAQAERSPIEQMPAEDLIFVADAIKAGTSFESAIDFADVDPRYLKYRGLMPKTQED